MNAREYFVETIQTALGRIQPLYGYNNEVKAVYKGEVDIKLIDEYPTLWIDIVDEQEENDLEKINDFTSKFIVVIGCLVSVDNYDINATGLLTDAINSIVGDIKDCLKQFKTNSISFSDFPIEVRFKTTRTSSPLSFIGNNNVREVQIQYELTYRDFEGVTNVINASVPDAPTITNPSNGSSVTTLNPSIDWNAVSEADYYKVEISTNSSFDGNIIIRQDFIQTSSYTIPTDSTLINGTTYYIRVKSANNIGYSDWSSTVGFMTNSTTVEPINWKQVPQAISWWNSYSSSAVQISSGAISGVLDQIGTRNLIQGTSSRRPSLSGNAYASISSIYFNPTFASESDVLANNDTTGAFKFTDSNSGSVMFVMMSDGRNFDYNSQYFCPLARSNNSFGSQYAFLRGVNTGPMGNVLSYPYPSTEIQALIPIALNVPHQIIITHSGSAHNVYLDGNLIQQINRANLVISNDGNSFFNIGAYYNGAGDHASGKYTGHIFEAGFATACLSAGVISALYEGHKQRFNLS